MMRKKIVKLALVFFAVFVVILLVIYNMLGSIVRTGIETIGPEATGAKVTLTDVDISLISGRAGLEGLVLGNPEGFKSESAFKLGEVKVDVAVGSVMDEVIIVENILIDGAEITWEGWSGDNHKKIMKNIEKYSGSEGKQPEEPKQGEADKPQKKVIIQNFVFQNSSIAFVVGGTQIAKIPFPDLHLRDIGRKQGGQSIAGALKQCYGQVFSGLHSAITKNQALLKKEAAKLQEKGKEILKEGQDTLKKGTEVFREGLGGLFKKK